MRQQVSAVEVWNMVKHRLKPPLTMEGPNITGSGKGSMNPSSQMSFELHLVWVLIKDQYITVCVVLVKLLW